MALRFLIFNFAFLINAFADVDLSKLPSPSTNRIEFTRDIKPILDASCLRCHGPERPKSGFSLITRESALKGGQNGVDIIPGNSTNSPLIHYVSRLVEDMEMPPPGKGEPLKSEQIGLLRAWIDQGAVWETTPPEPSLALTIAPTLGWTTVSGDEKKVREHHWMQDGWNGGVEDFQLTNQLGNASVLVMEGRALVDDYRVTLTLEKRDTGFIRSGWEQFRKYSDDTGGYYPGFDPSTFSLNRDLNLDVGKAWVEFGLTRPDWPRMTVGYEYQYSQGDISTLQWGAVGTTYPPNPDTRNIYPAAKSIDEHVHIIKFDLQHEIAGMHMENNFRGEFYESHTKRQDTISYVLGDSGPSRVDLVRESYSTFTGANMVRLEKSFTDWLFTSAGYLYSKLNADATFSLETEFPLGVPVTYFANRWNSQDIVLERETHAVNLSSLLGPWEGFTLSTGVLSDWTRQTGFGNAEVELVTESGPLLSRFATLDGDYDTTTVSENVALRYTKVPFTALYAEALFRQESRGLSEDMSGGFNNFMQQTDITTDVRDFRVGGSTSPWRGISWSAQYRHYERDTDYDNSLDLSDHAYPAFIRSRDTDTDQVETKLTLRPYAWLKTSLTYSYETTDYRISTDSVSESALGDISPGGGLTAAHYVANTLSANATLTPWRRFYFTGTFAYQHVRLDSYNNGSAAVVPYQGDRYSVLTSMKYALNDATDLNAGYAVSWADYAQHNYADGLPLGIHYQEHALTTEIARRINKNLSLKLRYGFFYYDEPSSGGANNYTAHAVFSTLVVKLP